MEEEEEREKTQANNKLFLDIFARAKMLIGSFSLFLIISTLSIYLS